MILALLATLANADEPVAVPPAPVDAAPPADVAPTDAELHDLEARALYKEGLLLVSDGRLTEACPVMIRVTTDYGGTSVAAGAGDQVKMIGAVEKAGPCAMLAGTAAPATLPPRTTEASGATELLISQAIVVPAFTGLLVPASLGATDEAIVPVSMGFVGLGGAIGGTLWYTRSHTVTEGQAMALYTGEIVGAWNGLAWTLAADPTDDKAPWQVMAVGTLGGAALGTVVAIDLRPSAGEMALVRSGATWGTYFGGVSFLFAPSEDATDTFVRLAGSTDLGLGVGAAFAYATPISRKRTNLINLSGYAGGVVGGGLAVLDAAYFDGDQTATGLLLTLGAGGGLVVGTLLTRNYEGGVLAEGPGLRLDAPSFGARPLPDGGYEAHVQLGGRF